MGEKRTPAASGRGMKTGLYRHYKGGLYVVIGTVHHHEDQAKMVVYWSVERNTFNVRPLAAAPHDPDGFSTPVVVNDIIRFLTRDTERFSFVREDELLVGLARARFDFMSISESLETRVSKPPT
jgi:hypothetical protein